MEARIVIRPADRKTGRETIRDGDAFENQSLMIVLQG